MSDKPRGDRQRTRPPQAKSLHPRGKGAARTGIEQLRQHLSTEAARIMAEEGVRDFQQAKRKAANRLNQPETKNWPSNQEIEAALTLHLQLFHGRKLPETLQHLRLLALEAMRLLLAFEPRLVGPVLSGNVTPYSEIQLHVSADTPEQIIFLLQDNHIPYDPGTRRLRFGGDRYEVLPTYRFVADNTNIEVTVFSHAGIREAPLSPVDGKPMRRAAVKEVEALSETTGASQP